MRTEVAGTEQHTRHQTALGKHRRHTRTRNASLPTQANHTARGRCALVASIPAVRECCHAFALVALRPVCRVCCSVPAASVRIRCFLSWLAVWGLVCVLLSLHRWSALVGWLSVLECTFWGFLPLFALLHLFPRSYYNETK